MNRNTDVFEKLPVPKAVIKMAIPTIIGQLIVLIYNIADTFFIGRTNNPFMVDGVSLILPLFNITLSLANLAGIGGGALISRLLGEKRHEEARKVFSFSIYLATLTAAFFSVIILVFMKPLLTLLGTDGDTYIYASRYALCVLVCGGIPTVLSNTLSTLLRSTGESKKAGLGITMGGLINIALDPLFMFVILPKGMEIIGAGVATLISNCVSCVYFVIVISRLGKDSVLRLSSPKNLPTVGSLKGIFSVGLPSSITTLLFDLDYVVIDKLMFGYGNIPLAAVGIVLKAERLPLNIGLGLCHGMLPIIAYNYSSKNYRRMNSVHRFTMLVGIGCAAVSIVLYQLFAGQIMRFFIADAGTIAYGTVFLRIRSVATPFMYLSFFHVYLFNGVGNGKRALFLGVVRWLGFNIPMLFILNHFIGMNGIVWAQLVADVMNVALSMIVYKRFEKREIKPYLNA